MAKTLQHRRGTTTELASVTGAIGEIFMDTTKNTLVVMDGTTAGGIPLAVEGSGGSGSSYDQSLNTTDDVLFNSALIGDVSIVGNTIAALDSYGNPSELAVSASSVAFDSDVNLSVNSLVSTTETVSAGIMNNFSFSNGMPGTPTFTYSGGFVNSSWADASKFVTGTIVTITSTMYGNAVIQLTSDMTYAAGWSASCTIISGGSSNISSLSSVSVTNQVVGTVDYSFDDQGVLTAPTVSTNSLLINGATAGLLTNNIDGSKSVVVDNQITTTSTVTSGSMPFTFSNGMFSYMANSSWADASKFVTGAVVTIVDSADGTVVIQLTSDIQYSASWNAPATVISETGPINTVYDSFSCTVSVIVGSTADYNFGNDGVFTTTTVSTDSLLINGTAPAFLTNNVDGSKSITVDTTNSTFYNAQSTSPAPTGYLVFQSASWSSNNFYLNSSSTETLAFFNSLAVGDTITLGDSMYGGELNTLTIAASGSTYDMAFNAYRFSVVETNTGMSKSFGYGYGVTVVSAVTFDYNFGTDGALSTTSLLADSALIGDVSIVGNTIAGVDSYGNADTLVVDGDLQVTGDLTSPSALTLTAGGGVITYDVNTGTSDTVNWNNDPALVFNSTMDTAVRTIVNALPIGSHIKFTHYMYGSFDLVTTSTAVNNMFGAPMVSVSQGPSSYGLGPFIFDIDNVTFEYVGPSSSYGFSTDGTFSSKQLSLNSTSSLSPYLTTINPGNMTVGYNNDNATRTQLYPDSITSYNIVSGTAADGGFVRREVFSGKSGGTNPNTTFSLFIPYAASLNGDISIIEVVVSAIRVDTTSTPNVLQSKSWKLRGYATKVNDTVTFTQIGTGPEVLADVNSSAYNPNVTLLASSGIILLQCDDSLNGDWTWGGEYTVTTAHVLVPGAPK